MNQFNPDDFNYYQEMLLKKSGLALAADKSYLLSTRLTPIASSLGYASLEAFTRDVRMSSDPSLLRSVIEAMTTNETSFFRDAKPFVMLKELLPDLMKARERTKHLRIWSAASSSGQEAYSIAIILQEVLEKNPGWRISITGTDISEEMNAQARRGEYGQFEIQRGLSIQQMVKYFAQDGNIWRIKDDLKNMVQFKYANLLDSIDHLGTFDIIFCRNVLIYFNAETKTEVLNKISRRLAPDGMLFLGACETTVNLAVPFEAMNGRHGILCPKKPMHNQQAAKA